MSSITAFHDTDKVATHGEHRFYLLASALLIALMLPLGWLQYSSMHSSVRLLTSFYTSDDILTEVTLDVEVSRSFFNLTGDDYIRSRLVDLTANVGGLFDANMISSEPATFLTLVTAEMASVDNDLELRVSGSFEFLPGAHQYRKQKIRIQREILRQFTESIRTIHEVAGTPI